MSMDASRLSSLEAPDSMIVTPNSYSSVIDPNSSAEIIQSNKPSLNSVIPSFSSSKSYDSPNPQYNYIDESNMVSNEPMKRKRGRPRKIRPNDSTPLELAPLTSVQSNDPPIRRRRGRPLGSGKKQQLAALGVAGYNLSVHVIIAESGEDVVSKIMAFSQQSSHSVCILSATGTICDVTLRPQTKYGGNVITYEGIFEILTLSIMESGSKNGRNGDMRVSLAATDGRVVGGAVAGMLISSTPVQVVVGCFMVEEKKQKPTILRRGRSSAMPPQGTSSNSSGEAASPLSQASGACNNSG